MSEKPETKEEVEEEEETVPQPSFKLYYFPFAGEAFSLRLAAYISGIAYTDEFVTEQEHQAAKQGNLRRWLTLPEIAIYGKDNKEIITIGQSNTCLRYVGNLCGLYPENPVYAALCDEVLDSVSNTRTAVLGSTATKEDRAKLITEDGVLTYWLKKFEARLEENKKRGNEGGYIVGKELSVADLKLFELFYGLWLVFELYEDTPDTPDLISKYPMIQAHYQLISTMESVQDFMQKFSLRNSEFKMDQTDEDIKVQTYKGKFVSGAL
eukprot:129636_1